MFHTNLQNKAVFFAHTHSVCHTNLFISDKYHFSFGQLEIIRCILTIISIVAASHFAIIQQKHNHPATLR